MAADKPESILSGDIGKLIILAVILGVGSLGGNFAGALLGQKSVSENDVKEICRDIHDEENEKTVHPIMERIENKIDKLTQKVEDFHK